MRADVCMCVFVQHELMKTVCVTARNCFSAWRGHLPQRVGIPHVQKTGAGGEKIKWPAIHVTNGEIFMALCLLA